MNYVSQQDIRDAIHDSKSTWCYFTKPEYKDYDWIVRDLNEVDSDLIAQIITDRSRRQNKHKRKYGQELPLSQDIVIRLMTYDHIPPEPNPLKRPGKVDLMKQTHKRVNFSPFKHFARIDNQLQEVGRSHWHGNLQTGHYSLEHGYLTKQYAQIAMLMTENYAKKPNWRGYSYVEEFKSAGLLRLVQTGLNFDESRSDNPFAYWTQILKNSFVREINVEREQHQIRDEKLIQLGQTPSHSYSFNHEHELELKRHGVQNAMPSDRLP